MVNYLLCEHMSLSATPYALLDEARIRIKIGIILHDIQKDLVYRCIGL